MERALLRARGIEVEEVGEERVEATQCPRCERLNAPGARWCQYCGLGLTEKEAFEDVETQKLLEDIGEFSRLPGWREFFSSLLEDAKAKLDAEFQKRRAEKD